MSEMCDRLRRSVAQLTIKMTDYTLRQKQKLVVIVFQPMKVHVTLISTISPLCPSCLDFFRYFFPHTTHFPLLQKQLDCFFSL